MEFNGFERGDPPSASYDVADGISVSVVDSAFNKVKATLVLNRGSTNKFSFSTSQTYEPDTEDPEQYAQRLLDEALQYHGDVREHIHDTRDRLDGSLPADAEVSPVEPNRSADLIDRSHDPSLYFFHITIERHGRLLRIYVGDESIPERDTYETNSEPYQRDSLYYKCSSNLYNSSDTIRGSAKDLRRELESEIRAWEEK